MLASFRGLKRVAFVKSGNSLLLTMKITRLPYTEDRISVDYTPDCQKSCLSLADTISILPFMFLHLLKRNDLLFEVGYHTFKNKIAEHLQGTPSGFSTGIQEIASAFLAQILAARIKLKSGLWSDEQLLALADAVCLKFDGVYAMLLMCAALFHNCILQKKKLVRSEAEVYVRGPKEKSHRLTTLWSIIKHW